MLESSVGPYNAAVTRVSEEQLLLNVVRLRYNDNPTRLDVASIAAQYELNASAEARPFFSAPNPAGSVFETFRDDLARSDGGAANRPTISLTPLDDPETIRGLFTPATLDGIVFLAETSYPLSTVFQLFVESINGVPNAPSASGPPRGIVPEFREFKRAAEILQQLKDLGDLQFVREEKLSEYGSHLGESSVTAGALVEAAKSGFEYQQQPDKSWSLVKRERRLMLQHPARGLAAPRVDRTDVALASEARAVAVRSHRRKQREPAERGPPNRLNDVQHLSAIGDPGVVLFVARRRGSPGTRCLRADKVTRVLRRQVVRLAGTFRRPVYRPLGPAASTAAVRFGRGEVPRLLVLYRRPRCRLEGDFLAADDDDTD